MFFISPRKRDFSLQNNPISPRPGFYYWDFPFYNTFHPDFFKEKVLGDSYFTQYAFDSYTTHSRRAQPIDLSNPDKNKE
jgi:hypothetical protein